tara:strand:+ start:364 stop:618 length:255 start_codon:yes stop_codon:yes gene_type:complete
MKQIKVNAYEYSELNQKAKYEVVHWLDEFPLDYETEDEQGNIIQELEYYSDMEQDDIIEHCEMNEYLFDKYGKCIHHLEIKKSE